MKSIAELKEILQRACVESNTVGLIKEFQEAVWDERGDLGDSKWAAILRDLAHELDYYELEHTARQQEAALFGRDQAIALIQAALRKLSEEAAGTGG